jgi:hypothetical protein
MTFSLKSLYLRFQASSRKFYQLWTCPSNPLIVRMKGDPKSFG